MRRLMAAEHMTAREHLAAAAQAAGRAYEETDLSRRPSRWWWQQLRHRRYAHLMNGLAVANALIALGYAVGADEEPATTGLPPGLDRLITEAHATRDAEQ